MLRFAAMFLVLAFASGANAGEMTTQEKMMEAAAIVLATLNTGESGTVVVDSESSAHVVFDRNYANVTVTFEKIKDCVYGIDETQSDGNHRLYFVDFNKINGRWNENGRELVFYGEPRSSCFNWFEQQKGCNSGIDFKSSPDHQQMLDDVSYMLRHGCNAAYIKAHSNDDPDPH